MKFADRAMKVSVKATVNEINPEDDKLVQKLRREIMHLKEVLQMRRNKTQQEVNLELLRLKEKNSSEDEVEKLKRENQRLKLILKDNNQLMLGYQKAGKSNQNPHEQYDKDDIGKNDPNFKSNTSTNDSKEIDNTEEVYHEVEEIRSIMDKENHDQNEMKQNDSGFFITEAEAIDDVELPVIKKAIKPPLPSILDVLTDSKARETVLSTTKKSQTDTSMKKNKSPKILKNSFNNQTGSSQDINTVTPTSMNKDFSRLSNYTDGELKTRVTREMGLHEIHSAAQNLKQGMATQNRCTVCTLKLPCKHFETPEQMAQSFKPRIMHEQKTVDYSTIPPLPRISSMSMIKRTSLPPVPQISAQDQDQEFSEKDSSF